MNDNSDITSLCNKLRSNLQRLADEVLKAMNEETNKAVKDAKREFGEYQIERIKDIFNESIDAYYGAYSPGYYDRQGDMGGHSGGLYDLLNTVPGSTGIVRDSSAEDLVDESRMHAGREGFGGLYEIAYKRGWHGGAASGPDHPLNGTPYYRTPYEVYSYWGRKAVISTPPSSIFEDSLSRLKQNELKPKFNEIVHRHNDQAMERVRNMIPMLRDRIS